MVITYSKSIDQTGIVSCRSYSWSAEQGKWIFSCPRSRIKNWSPETGSAVPSRVSPLIIHTQAESDWLVLTHGIPPAFRDGVYSSIPSTVIRHRVSPELIRSQNYVPMAFTAESPPTQGQKPTR